MKRFSAISSSEPGDTGRTIAPDLVAKFATIVGDKYVIRDPQALESFVTEGRGLYRGRTQMVLRPGSVAEVSAILKLANDTRTPIVPQGGNTGLVGGQIPHDGEIIVSLTRLDNIREVDPTSNTMICEAGVVLAKAQDAAASAGRLFPLSLGAEGSCTIGGNLSTNAGGTAVLAYGNARELVMGLEVVLADGRILNNLTKLRKDNTGYDLKNLFVGAEGTLGIITAAVLKLFPRPQAVETAFVGVPSPRAALSLLRLAVERTGGSVTGFELIPRIAVEFAVRHGAGCRDPLQSAHAWYVLLELSSQAREGLRTVLENLLEAGLEQNLVEDAVIAESLDHANAFWHLRTMLTEVQKPEGGSIKHDVSVPVAAVPAFIEEASAAVQALVPGSRPVPFGHLGDGNIHYNVSQPIDADKAGFLARWSEMNDVVHGIVARLNGSISAEHGIGVLKRDLLPGVKDPVALDLMRTLKRTLDPNGILNPGKVL
ncbi:MAG TPA: FAD-binding oxidoreductase [Xanthobacteraceae bacterium]|nr:FAD-binding oxidoreductase [Xanthobacteraceae bacterium]